MKRKKKSNKDYWRDRMLALEETKEGKAERLSKETKKVYQRQYRLLENEVNALYVEMMGRGKESIPREELINFSHYQKLMSLMGEIAGVTASTDIKKLEALLLDTAYETYAAVCEGLGVDFNIISEYHAKALVETDWSGAKFDSRIWKNAEAFNSRVMDDIEKAVISGMNPETLKKQLVSDFGVRYHEADRLIRTEASHVYNTAAIDSYKEAGLSFVEFLAEADCCELCEPYSGRKYPIEAAPTIPVHPNCRCTYLPVIDEK